MNCAVAKRDTSIRARVIAFYISNPEEELTRSMLMIKFGLNYNTAKSLLRDLYAEGMLEHVKVIRLKMKAGA